MQQDTPQALQQLQQIRHRIDLHMGIAQQRLGRRMPHPAFHQQQRVAHHEPPGRKRVPQRVQRQLRVDRREEPAHALREHIGVKAP